MKPVIYICYRRGLASPHAHFIKDRINRELGAQSVFMDIGGIPLGEDYHLFLSKMLSECVALVVLINPGWGDLRDSSGTRRLHLPDDFVRIEILSAIKSIVPIKILPILLDGARMPTEDILPEELAPITKLQAIGVDFSGDPTASLAAIVKSCREAFYSRESAATLVQSKEYTPSRPRWAMDSGTDLYGVWADFCANDVTQRMRWIPPGSFRIGAALAEQARFDIFDRGSEAHKLSEELFFLERPQHEITLSGFWLAETACTQELWSAVLSSSPSAKRNLGADKPVNNISWRSISEVFLPNLGKIIPGFLPILPNEAQWEYACRAGTTSAFNTGDDLTTEQANYYGKYPPPNIAPWNHDRYPELSAVKNYHPNRWGLYQMHGGVRELCQDWLKIYPYNPRDTNDALHGAPRKVTRGGGFDDSARNCRSAWRTGISPEVGAAFVGFRIAVDL